MGEQHSANQIALLNVLKDFANGDKEKLKDLYVEFVMLLYSNERHYP